MPRRVSYSPEARDQLLEIFRYVAGKANSEIASAHVDAIIQYCESFVTFPYRGTRRDDLEPGLRIVGFKRRATIVFAVDGDTIEIVAVFGRGRQIIIDPARRRGGSRRRS